MVWVFDHLRFNQASGFLKRHTGSLITEGFSAESVKNGPSSVMCMNSCRSALAFLPVGVDLLSFFFFFFLLWKLVWGSFACRSWSSCRSFACGS